MSKQSPIIGVDLASGDIPGEALFEDLMKINEPLEAHLVFFIPSRKLPQFKKLADANPPSFSLSFSPTKSSIKMADAPLSAIRFKRESAIPLGLTQLKEGTLDAFVSSGNTGALIAEATLSLEMLSPIKRPGLLAILPTNTTPLAVIDVGANVSCKADHLVQFAKMGFAYQKCSGIKHPKIGLLNIGVEKEKGRVEFREAYKELSKLNSAKKMDLFVGNIEGLEAFNGHVNVLVTDGVSGNIFLKTVEGMTSFILSKLYKENIHKNNKSSFEDLITLLDYAEYPGALICGVDGIVVKCHGYSSAKAIHSGIKGAARLIESRFLEKIKTELKSD